MMFRGGEERRPLRWPSTPLRARPKVEARPIGSEFPFKLPLVYDRGNQLIVSYPCG